MRTDWARPLVAICQTNSINIAAAAPTCQNHRSVRQRGVCGTRHGCIGQKSHRAARGLPCVLPACMRQISVPEPDIVVQVSGLLGRYLSAGAVQRSRTPVYARVGSESVKRRDKLDGRAKGRTGSLWAPGRLGKCIGCGPPDTFEKYRHRGTGVPATTPGHRERRARVRAGRTVFLVSGRRARGRGRGARRGERSVRLPPGLLGRVPLSRRIEYTNRRVPLYTSTAVHTTFLMWGVSLQR